MTTTILLKQDNPFIPPKLFVLIPTDRCSPTLSQEDFSLQYMETIAEAKRPTKKCRDQSNVYSYYTNPKSKTQGFCGRVERL